MLYSTLLLAVSAALPVFASPLDFFSDLVFHHDEARQEARACLAGNVSTDPDFSYYKFHINAEVNATAAANGFPRLGVRQLCDGNDGFLGVENTNTENWKYTDLTNFGPDQPYTIEVNRCKKGNSRRVASYSVWLCNENDFCGGAKCGLDRGVCNEEKSKAVDITDTETWVCPT